MDGFSVICTIRHLNEVRFIHCKQRRGQWRFWMMDWSRHEGKARVLIW